MWRVKLIGIGDLLTGPDQIRAEAVSKVVAPDFSTGSLRPSPLSIVFQEEALVVKRLVNNINVKAGPAGRRDARSR